MKLVITSNMNATRWPCRAKVGSAFTLLELLVVIVIIGILAAIGLPAIRGMSKSNSMVAANRQLLDDLAYARRRAISDHTTVYVVFMPPFGNFNRPTDKIFKVGNFPVDEQPAVSNLWSGQYTSYAMLTLRTVGDQPGRPTPRYLTSWRTLPSGIFIRTNKFDTYNSGVQSEYARAFPPGPFFPYPVVSSNSTTVQGLPYIAFNFLGQLATGQSEVIPLAHGSIFYPRDPNGVILPGAADVQETPAGNSYYDPKAVSQPPGPPNTQYNVVYIDWLTGKAHVEKQEIQ